MRHIYTASNIGIPNDNVYQDISNMFNKERIVRMDFIKYWLTSSS